MKNKRQYFILVLVLILAGCDVYTSQIIDATDYYEKDQLVVLGYLSNKGAVVNLKRTVSPLGNPNNVKSVGDVSVQLFTSTNKLAAELSLFESDTYVTDPSFIPDSALAYYVKIQSDEFGEITSTSQVISNKHKISVVELQIEEKNYWVEDTTIYYLFGRPRQIWASYGIDNSAGELTNNVSRFLFEYDAHLYTYGEKNFEKFNQPTGFMRLKTGVKTFVEEKDTIGDNFRFFDQISTETTLEYGDSVYHVIDRIDGLLVQSFVFSDSLVMFFEAVNEYMEGRYDPFSIVAEPVPCNIDNGAGYFGSVIIAERKVKIPEIKEGRFIYWY